MKTNVTLEFDSPLEAAKFLADLAGDQLDAATSTSTGELPTVDADGMPYSADVHSNPPSLTAKGLWKSQKGKAEQAEAARAAFKASGGGVMAPAPVAPIPLAATMPAMSVAVMPTMPAMPVAAVSMDDLMKKIESSISSGKLTPEGCVALYGKAGASGPHEFVESAPLRAALFALLP